MLLYKANIKQLFNATILRQEPLTKVLKLLELNGYVHFKTENDSIYVLPWRLNKLGYCNHKPEVWLELQASFGLTLLSTEL